MSKITTIEFAERIGLTYGRVHQFIRSGEIVAEKIGRDYLIDEKFLEIIRTRPERRGRKPKNPNVVCDTRGGVRV